MRRMKMLGVVLAALLSSVQVQAQEKENMLQGVEAETTKVVVPNSREQIRFSYAPLVKRLSPAVVNVYVAKRIKRRASPFAGDPFFEQFFGNDGFGGRPRQRIARSLGSGVIVEANGIVITNHHVIKGADQVKVALSDGREYEARILLVDEKSDLAVLKMEALEDFPVVELGDAEDLQVGDLVLAIGNPFGVGQTVTSGIVSALARSQRGIKDFNFFIQTDASINPGNSGGALVSMDGKLVGINTAIYTRSGGSNGIGFAVPSNMVRVVLQSVKQGSKTLLRPWVGAQFQAVTAEIADSLGMARPQGALVAGIVRGSPIDEAGVRVGDVILTLDGKPIEQLQALGYRLATAGLNRTVDMDVLSKGRRKTLRIRLAPAPEKPARDLRRIGGRSPFTGATVANLSPRVAQEMGLPTSKRGVVVMEVRPRSPAARFGLRPKDIIFEVIDERVRDTRQLADIAQYNYRDWSFVLERKGKRYRQFVR